MQDPKRIQDTDDVGGNGDTGGMAKRDTLPMARKVRWKDLKEEEAKQGYKEDACFILKSG